MQNHGGAGRAILMTFLALAAPVVAVVVIALFLWLMLRLGRRLLNKAESSNG